MAEKDNIIKKLVSAQKKLNSEETATAFEGVKALFGAREYEYQSSWEYHVSDFNNMIKTVNKADTAISGAKAMVDSAAVLLNELVIKKPNDRAVKELKGALKNIQEKLHNITATNIHGPAVYFKGILAKIEEHAHWTEQDSYARNDWLTTLQNHANDVRTTDELLAEAIAIANKIA